MRLVAGKMETMNGHSRQSSGVAGQVSTDSGAGKQLPSDEELREIAASLRGLRYGSISVVVQDGVVIQIDRIEKRRLRGNRQASDNARS